MILYVLYAAMAVLTLLGIGYFCSRHTRYRATFRSLREDTKPEYEKYRVGGEKHPSHAGKSAQTILLLMLLLCAMPADAVYYGQASRQVNRFWRLDEAEQYKDRLHNEQLPQTISTIVADGFANLYVEYEGRICPLTTLSDAFCRRLYGRRSYKGLNSMQVLMGWIFYPADWETRQMIECDSVERQDRLGMIELVRNADVMRVLPGDTWQSWNSETDSTGYIHTIVQAIARGDNAVAYDRLCAFRRYQQQTAERLPSDIQFRCEQILSAIYFPAWAALVCCVIGLAFFVCFLILFSQSQRGRTPRWLTNLQTWLCLLMWLVLTAYLTMRWFVVGHAPVIGLSEQLSAMAWFALSIVFVLAMLMRRRGLKGMLNASLMLTAGIVWMLSARLEVPMMVVALNPWMQIGVLLVQCGESMLMALALLNIGMLCISLVRKGVEQACVNTYHISHLVITPSLWIMSLGLLAAMTGQYITTEVVWIWSMESVLCLVAMGLYVPAVFWHPRHQLTVSMRQLRRFELYVVVCFVLLAMGRLSEFLF